MSSVFEHSPDPSPYRSTFSAFDASDDDDADTASQLSISLSSAPASPRHLTMDSDEPSLASQLKTPRPEDYRSYIVDTDVSSEADDTSVYTSDRDLDRPESSISSAAPSVSDSKPTPSTTYPPTPLGDTDSITSSLASGSSKKARPESLLVEAPEGPLILGVALVDFNHLVGPKIEFSQGAIFDDEDIVRILPFLALPDGAHLSTEDYSYFHLVPSSPKPATIFGISCNRQIQSSELLVKKVEVTRSTVQKAVVVLASKPVFGPIRDKLGVVTRALFEQRDFAETDLLVDFHSSLETSLRSQLTESGLYMGTSLRELVHTFRQRTLMLVKALMLQKKILFFGHPVEKLCTHQYSLVSLMPGLLQTLEDCGSPPLASRARTLSRPNSLRTSDRKSLMAYLGLPLDIFGKDAFFQPYLPLQQLDMIKETKSWLCGSTNSIVTQQKEMDLLVNIETNTFEFRDPKLERSAGLTAADRKWMDEIVKDVNDSWAEGDSAKPTGMHFKGSDDYLRSKFEEYICAALASVKYSDFLAKGKTNGVLISDGSGADANSMQDFNPLWIAEFRKTNAYEVWDRVTDPMLFDISEPRHPCGDKPSVVADIGLRLSEGIQELKLEEQLAPTREAISRTISAGSTNFFKAVEGVRGRWLQRSASSDSNPGSTASSSTVEVSKADVESLSSSRDSVSVTAIPIDGSPAGQLRPLSVTASQAAAETKAAISSWSTGFGSFLSSRAARFSLPRGNTGATPSPTLSSPADRSSLSSVPTPSPVNPVKTRTTVDVGQVDRHSEELEETAGEGDAPGIAL